MSRPDARHLAAVGLCALFWAAAVDAGRNTSPAFDETVHLAAGYAYWKTGDYRMHPENGVLPQRLAALPLLLRSARLPPLDNPVWFLSDKYSFAQQFLYESGNDPEAMLRAGRAMIAALGALLGWVVFRCSSANWGTGGGLLSLLAYLFCPTMLAHAGLVTSDLSAALFLTLSVTLWWRVLHRMSTATLLSSATAWAGLFLSKFSAGILLPIAALLACIRLLPGAPLELDIGRPRRLTGRGPISLAFLLALTAHVVVVVAVIWLAYGCRFSALRSAEPGRDQLWPGWESVLEERSPVVALIETARDHRLLPEAYLFGFAHVLRFTRGRNTFLNGETSNVGWASFFPYAFLVKSSLPLLLLIALGLAALVAARRGGSNGETAGWRFHDLRSPTPLLVLVAVYCVFAVASRFNIGHRHLLPIYPALFILAGAAARWLRPRTPLLAGLTVFALLWAASEALRVRPHYLAYFNQVSGGPAQGYRHLVDSSLDWGQDLPGLRRWLDRNAPGGENAPVYLSYFGSAIPEFYGIRARRLPGFLPAAGDDRLFPLTGGSYCVSATMLQGVYSPYPGPWCVPYEQDYQRARAAVGSVPDDSAGTDDAAALARLRFSRLCAFLRNRQPDAQIGYSILIFRLTDADLRQALEGPPPELAPAIRVRGLTAD